MAEPWKICEFCDAKVSPYPEPDRCPHCRKQVTEVVPLSVLEAAESRCKGLVDEAANELRTRARRLRELDPDRRGLNRDGHCTAKASAFEHAAEIVESLAHTAIEEGTK